MLTRLHSTCLHALARMLARLYVFTCLQAYSKIGPTSFQDRTRTGGNFLPPVCLSRSTVQDRLKRSHDCSKMAQDHSKIGPRRPKIVPRSFQNGWQLFATLFLSRNTVQDHLKSFPRSTQTTPRSPKTAPDPLQDRPNTAQDPEDCPRPLGLGHFSP